MRVVDTSAWIEWLVGSPLGKRLATDLPPREQCVVPTIVQLELAKWISRELDEDRADQVVAYTQLCVVAPLDTRTALLAAELHRQHNSPPPTPSSTPPCSSTTRICSRATRISRSCRVWSIAQIASEDVCLMTGSTLMDILSAG